MRMPITLALLLPILYTCFAVYGDSGVLLFVAISLLSFLIEAKLRLGNLSWKNIVRFFNTPIVRRGLHGQEIVDNSPQVSLLKGVTIILAGAVFVVAALILFFTLTQSP